jgi:hypothetical protein
MSYLVNRNGQQFGPYTIQELQQYVGEGRISATDLAWTEGMAEWKTVGQVLGMGATGMAAPLPPGSPVPPGGGYSGSAVVPVKPESYMVAAILVTLLCCLPFGIVSIIYAAQVNSKFEAGDYEGAQAASKNARTWYLVSLVVGLIIIGLSALGGLVRER